GTRSNPPSCLSEAGFTFARIWLLSATIDGTPFAASRIIESNTSCISGTWRIRPSTLTACFFKATLRVSFLRSTKPFGRPLLLPDVPLRNWYSLGGGLRPGPGLVVLCIVQLPQKVLV